MILNLTKKTLFALLLFLFAFPAVKAQGLHTEGQKIVDAKGKNVVLRGIGLGGWMLQEGYMLKIEKESQQYRIRERLEDLIGTQETADFYALWLKNHTRKIDIDSLKAWGFNSVRLPMHYNLYTLPVEKEAVAGKNTWLDKGFAMTDSLLAWCKANHMYLILDLHATPGGQGNDMNIADRDPSKPSLWESEANQQKTIALWKKLAERYVNEPWIGGYDLINEPNYGFENLKEDPHGLKEQKNAPLQKLLVEITKAIRSVDQKHMIIIEGNGWGNNYNGMKPDWDKNLTLSFHKYWNFNDQASVAHILKMRNDYNMPAWLGETGENSNVWFTDAIRLLEKNNIGWSWWPLKKIGNNNPAEVISNPNYNSVTAYFNGKGPKPAKSDAYQGVMELASHLKLEQTIIHRDVIDAMMRQPFTSATLPFKSNVIDQHSLLQAVDYDLGISGAAYLDKDSADYRSATGKSSAGNKGHVYRNDGVDISKDSTRNNAYYVSSIEAGEWLQYTLDVKQSGNYTLKLGVASDNTAGKISLTVNGTTVLKAISVTNTGQMTRFEALNLNKIKLNKGKQVIRVYADAGGFNFSNLQFDK